MKKTKQKLLSPKEAVSTRITVYERSTNGIQNYMYSLVPERAEAGYFLWTYKKASKEYVALALGIPTSMLTIVRSKK